MKHKVVLSGLRSDSHTWGLAFLQLWLEERGVQVVNLGSCVMPTILVETCRSVLPSLIVLTSVNGHGAAEAAEALSAIRSSGYLSETPVVIGGKLTTSVDTEEQAKSQLLAEGFAQVFIGAEALNDLDKFLLSVGLKSFERTMVHQT